MTIPHYSHYSSLYSHYLHSCICNPCLCLVWMSIIILMDNWMNHSVNEMKYCLKMNEWLEIQLFMCMHSCKVLMRIPVVLTLPPSPPPSLSLSRLTQWRQSTGSCPTSNTRTSWWIRQHWCWLCRVGSLRPSRCWLLRPASASAHLTLT